MAADVTLVRNDASTQSSFNASTNWSVNAVPSAGNNYFTSTFLLRTPETTGTFTFQGDALRVDAGGQLAGKTKGLITVNNLILAGGRLTNSGVGTGSENVPYTLGGGITLVSSTTSTLDSAGGATTFGRAILVTATISGTGNLLVTGTTVSGTSTFVSFSGSNTFTGTTTVASGALVLAHSHALGRSIVVGGTGTGVLSFGSLTAATFGGLTGSSGIVLSNTAAQAVTLTVGANGQNTTYSGGLTGIGGLTKSGTGSLTLSGSQGFSGATTVSAGRLQVAATGRLNATSGITVNGTNAEFNYNSATALTAPLTLTQGTLSGTGAINTSVTVGSNAIHSPGNSPGLQTVANETWAPGGTYLWEINNWTGTTAGTDFDQIAVTGTLNVAATSGSTFRIQVAGLDGSNAVGAVPNFSNAARRQFTIATSGSLNGFAVDEFTVDWTTSFSGSNSLNNGGFAIGSSGNNVVLTYIPSAVSNLAATANATAIRVGGTSAITATLTSSTATVTNPDSLAFTGLALSNGLGVVAASGTVAAGGSATGTTVYTGTAAGAFTFTPSLSSGTNATINTVAIAGSTSGVTVAVYNLASATNAQTINVGNMYAGSTKTAVLSLANTAPVNATYTETLSTGSFSNTSANFTASGSANGIVGGQSGTGSLLVGLGSGLAAGAASGTTVLSLFSNAVNGSGLAQQAIAPQTITITGGVYNMAAAAAAQTVNVGNVHVGDTATKSVTLTNTAPVDATYTETLASNGFSSTSAGFTATGSVAGIAGGTSASGSLLVGFSTGSAGARSGSTVLSLNSQAVNSSGLGTTNFTTQTITITGTVFNYAAANSISTPITLGNVYVGGTFGTASLTISNTAPSTFSEGLNAAFGGKSGIVSNNAASITNLVGGGTDTTTMMVGLGGSANTGVVGALSGTQSITLVSSGANSGLSDTNLASQTLSISGTVWNPAAVNTLSTVTLANVRVGGTFASTALTVTNTAPGGSYTEVLGATGTTTGLASLTGAVAALAGGSSSTAIAVGLGGGSNTGSAGIKSGSAILSFTSSGGPGTFVPAAQTIAISGTVFNYAAANSISGTLNMGTVLTGTPLSHTLTISNTAPNGGFSEKLDAAFGTLTGGATTNGGSVGLLAAGSTNNTAMTVYLASGSAGAAAGSAQVTFASNGAGTSGLGTASLGSQTVSLTGTVLDPAVASFASGSSATSSLVLNFNTVNKGDTVSPLGFNIYNLLRTAGYTADLALTGIVPGTGNTSALTTNLTTFTSLVSGSFNSWQAFVDAADQGTFSNTWTLQFKSSNGGTVFAGDSIQTLILTANVVVVPEPGGLALAGIGIAAVARSLRRRR